MRMVYPLRDEGKRIADASLVQLDKTTNEVFNALIADIIEHYGGINRRLFCLSNTR